MLGWAAPGIGFLCSGSGEKPSSVHDPVKPLIQSKGTPCLVP